MVAMNTIIRQARRFLAVLFLTFIGTLVVAPVTFAASDVPPPPAADAGTTTDVTWLSLDASTVLWIGAVLIPVIGGLVLKIGASQRVQTAVGLFLSGVWSLIVTATTEGGDAVLSKTLVMNFLQSFVISIATLYGFYKPIGADSALKEKPGLVGPKPPAS